MSELHEAGASVTDCVIKYYITWEMMKGLGLRDTRAGFICLDQQATPDQQAQLPQLGEDLKTDLSMCLRSAAW